MRNANPNWNNLVKIKTKKINKMSKINIKPLADRVLVESAEAEEKTASGIIIPDTAKEKPQEGKIIAVGTGKKDEPITVKVGDKVLYGKYYAAQIVAAGTQAGMLWLVFTYFFHTVGELALSPVGLSATTKLAPRAYMGQMMGIWFVGASVGNLIAGLFAGGLDPNNVQEIPNLFMTVVFMGVGSGILFIVFSGLMKKWMGNVN